MANAYKRLAALRPANTNEAELYLVPASTEALVTVSVCNQGAMASTFSIAFTDAAGAAANEDWLIYQRPIDAKDTQQITGIAMEAGNSIRIVAGTADQLSFIAHGMEIT